MAPVFPDSHPIERVRGQPIPHPDQVRRELSVRIAWLQHRISLRTIDRKSVDSEIRELAAWAVLSRLLDDAYPPPENDTDRPPAPTGDEP